MRFNYIKQWRKHKLESLLENKIHKILCDFEIQADYPNQARRSDLININEKENMSDSGYCSSIRLQSESEKLENHLNLVRELRKMVGHY